MDTRRLSYFTCILEEGSITAAAQRLRLSQPTLTKAMKLLEDEFGVILFERSMMGITPTSYGEALYKRAKAILSDMQRAQEEIATLRGLAGEHCRIGALPTVMGNVVANAVNEISRRFPALKFYIQEGQTQALVRALRRRELDLVLVYRSNLIGEHTFAAHMLFCDRLAVVAGARHPLVGRTLVTVADLAPYPWCTAGNGNWPCIEQMFRSEGIEPHEPRVDPGGAFHFVKGLVGASEYLTVLPQHAVAAEIARGELFVLPIKSVSLNRTIVALQSKEVELPAYGRALLAAISRAAQALHAENTPSHTLPDLQEADLGSERWYARR